MSLQWQQGSGAFDPQDLNLTDEELRLKLQGPSRRGYSCPSVSPTC